MNKIQALSESEIKKLSFEEQKEYFLKIYRQIIKELNDKDKQFYFENVKKINSLPQRIKFLQSFMDVAQQNKKVVEIFDYIQINFPENYDQIKGEYEKRDEEDRFFYIVYQKAQLEELLPSKLKNDILALERELRRKLSTEEFLELTRHTKNFKTLRHKRDFLKEYKKKIEKIKK